VTVTATAWAEPPLAPRAQQPWRGKEGCGFSGEGSAGAASEGDGQAATAGVAPQQASAALLTNAAWCAVSHLATLFPHSTTPW
jgi:hypothetical protein